MTSAISVGSTMLTFQTEIRGAPPDIVTIVVNKGRTLKVFRRPLSELQAQYPDAPMSRLAERSHAEVIGRLKLGRRQKVEAPASSPASSPAPAAVEREAPKTAGQAVSLLFLMAVEAYDKLDHQAAMNLLEAAHALAPADARISRSMERLRPML
jgi:hypothetical protein